MKASTISRWTVGPLALGLAVAASGSAQAQPAGGAPMGQNPPNWNQGGGGQRGGGRMTAEQRAQMMEQFTRQALIAFGVTEKDTQDSLVEFLSAQQVAATPLQEKQRALLVGLANAQTTPEQITTLLTDWQTAATAEKTRRETALKDLDTSISYTKSPRLTALLTVMGVLGDESSLTSGMAGIAGAMMGGRGGMGGMMGGMGGMMGGMGGMMGGGGQGGRRNGRGGQGGQGGQNNGAAAEPGQ